MNNKKTNKPSALANATPSYKWKDREDYKKENRTKLRKSMDVALRILDILEERNMSQQDLANKLSVTRQQVSKILKGQENMTFETIHKLEKGLGIELVKVLNGKNKIQDPKNASVAYKEKRYFSKAKGNKKSTTNSD
jgi:transcriptional regulator with XRE-family HTH domain